MGNAIHTRSAERVGDHEEWLALLRHNHGFDDPDRWVSYARSHGFHRVDATPLPTCPDCGEARSSVLGQYVYYSTLLRLRLCERCGLAYVDAHIDPRVIREHFETAYKDETYFVEDREPIFRYLAEIVDAHAPRSSKVIDIGGAKGHLLAAIRARRPDLSLMLNDIAEKACAYAREAYGLPTVRGSAAELIDLRERFDVILDIDALYYETDISALWRAIERLGSENCVLIFRIPDRLGIISLQSKFRTMLGRDHRKDQTAIRHFNPEHLYVFSKSYLRRRLEGLRFTDVRFLPSPLLRRSGIGGLFNVLVQRTASVVHRATRGAATLTPSYLVVARRFRG